ncbi:hypothetical protein L873DRAFT_1820765 [Choiromyces venosus 120613-1]|uniref:Ubiquitin 3 binding protein But2 C-terminal domain-containing protein n=1 Tax=Choiromyces venosus 120613-1 TaxID=1336337 RepID=A0A3N4J0I5_9PEZI|nr:hypothetical protein L873DRAFT_1820765 [Choiromyces venosus 120613-1]
MKFTVIAAISILSTLASGLVLPDLTPRDAPIHLEVVIKEDFLATVFHPPICIVIKEDYPITAFPPAAICEVSRSNGSHNVKTLLGFNLPAFPPGKKCTISFSDASSASGSFKMQLFTTIGCPAYGNTWYYKPSTNIHKGTFQTSTSGAGKATVVDDYGLTFNCPIVPTWYCFEVQPVGDDDKVTWNRAWHGFIITAA